MSNPPDQGMSKSKAKEFTDFRSGAILFDANELSTLRPAEVPHVLPRWINVAHMPTRLQARRALLMHMLGGECSLRRSEKCRGVIEDYHRVSGYYEFDHLHEVETHAVSPTSGMRQFRISGSDCTRRAFETVSSHCLADCRLVCVPCHIERTEHSRWRRARTPVAG